MDFTAFPICFTRCKKQSPLPHVLLLKPVLNPIMQGLFFERMREVGIGKHKIYHPSPNKKKSDFMVCCLIKCFLGGKGEGGLKKKKRKEKRVHENRNRGRYETRIFDTHILDPMQLCNSNCLYF